MGSGPAGLGREPQPGSGAEPQAGSGAASPGGVRGGAPKKILPLEGHFERFSDVFSALRQTKER